MFETELNQIMSPALFFNFFLFYMYMMYLSIYDNKINSIPINFLAQTNGNYFLICPEMHIHKTILRLILAIGL